MNYSEALQYLDSFIDYEKRGDYSCNKEFSLDRMRRLSSAFGDPHSSTKAIHIAGTKGKGSTAAMVQSILSLSGFKAGLYTSPHLVTLRERIRIGDELISEGDLCRLTGEIKKIIESSNSLARPTFFELYTALAFLYFKEKKADFAVYEVGMGGRLDATNVIDPLVCGITSLSLDHMKALGGSLEDIAFEKAGIIKDGSVCVASPQEDGARQVIESCARLKNARLFTVGRDILFEKALSTDAFRQRFSVLGIFGEYPLCELGLLGDHQLQNAATAIGIIEALRFSDIIVGQGAIREGLRNTRWPGRFEVLKRSPDIILDGAHNRASAAALARTLGEIFGTKKVSLILGVSKDKDIKGIIEELEGASDRVFLTKSRVLQRAEEPDNMRRFFKGSCPIGTSNLPEALDKALAETPSGGAIVITGSLFLVGEARSILVGEAV